MSDFLLPDMAFNHGDFNDKKSKPKTAYFNWLVEHGITPELAKMKNETIPIDDVQSLLTSHSDVVCNVPKHISMLGKAGSEEKSATEFIGTRCTPKSHFGCGIQYVGSPKPSTRSARDYKQIPSPEKQPSGKSPCKSCNAVTKDIHIPEGEVVCGKCQKVKPQLIEYYKRTKLGDIVVEQLRKDEAKAYFDFDKGDTKLRGKKI